MENQIELPPGFRFHPTDEELIIHYLHPKVCDNSFSAIPIGKVDLNKVEPWDLPWCAKMGEDEWYFFCVKDKKYPTGSRTNRATEAGYWKATGKDKEIFRAKKLIGMKKTLVFYQGRAPSGQKTNWVMHEFRLEGNNLPITSKEWVISRIFHKNSSGKKTHVSKLAREIKSNLPPLLDMPTNSIADTSHVTCFSGQLEDRKPQDQELFNPSSSVLPTSSSSPKPPPALSTQFPLQYPDSFMMQHQSILGLLTEDDVEEIMKQSSKTEFSTGGMSTDISSNQDQQYAITSAGPPLDLDSLWSY